MENEVTFQDVANYLEAASHPVQPEIDDRVSTKDRDGRIIAIGRRGWVEVCWFGGEISSVTLKAFRWNGASWLSSAVR